MGQGLKLRHHLDAILETNSDATVIQSLLNRRSLGRRYIDEFIRLTCAPDLMASRAFPNGKEITESMACYDAVRKHISSDFKTRDTNIVVVGDGAAPRTGLLFAYRSNWDVFSVDPRLVQKDQYRADRLTLLSCKVQDMHHHGSLPDRKNWIIILPHAHVGAIVAVAGCMLAGKGPDHLSVVAMPCCVPIDMPRAPDACYQDPHIWSPKRTIKIWKEKLYHETDH